MTTELLLALCYGNKSRALHQASVGKAMYEASPNQTQKVVQRAAEYAAIITELSAII